MDLSHLSSGRHGGHPPKTMKAMSLWPLRPNPSRQDLPDFPRTRAVLWADDTLFELFHRASRAILSDPQAPLQHRGQGCFGLKAHRAPGQHLITISWTAIIASVIICLNRSASAHLQQIPAGYSFLSELNDRIDFIVRDKGTCARTKFDVPGGMKSICFFQ